MGCLEYSTVVLLPTPYSVLKYLQVVPVYIYLEVGTRITVYTLCSYSTTYSTILYSVYLASWFCFALCWPGAFLDLLPLSFVSLLHSTQIMVKIKAENLLYTKLKMFNIIGILNYLTTIYKIRMQEISCVRKIH